MSGADCKQSIVNADALNKHYASISTDPDYVTPRYKYSAGPPSSDYISEWRIFFALDHLRSTATGLDELPAWFLRLGAPLFYKLVAQLFNLSIASSTVPLQWKRASIRPVPKVTNPQILSDFRPISVTPVLALPSRTGHLTDENFMQRMLYLNSY